MLRPQADTGNLPSQQSLNPAAFWPRGQESWIHGAGQTQLDRPDSDPAMFRSSKGVDPWTEWRLGLLNATARKLTSAETNTRLAVAGAYLHVIDGDVARRTADVDTASPTWTALTGTSSADFTSLTSDGKYLYGADGAGVYRWAKDASAIGAVWNTTNAHLVKWIPGKGRLMAADNTAGAAKVWNITGAAAQTDVTPAVISEDAVCVGFAESASSILGAFYQGDKSLVFRWGIKSDGTGLDAAVPALAFGLPDGEIVASIDSGTDGIKIGTDKGVRYAVADGNGDLTVGPITPTTSPVLCFESQDAYTWFGLTNYDATSTGLGRLSAGAFVDTLVPAWASDLMATAQGAVTSVVTFQDLRVFTVSGSGVWVEDSVKVASGTLDSGLMTYGLADDKVAMRLSLRHRPLDGAVLASLSVEEGDFVSVGSSSTAGSISPSAFPTGQRRGENFEVRLELERSAADMALGPEVTRYTLKAYPAPQRAWIYTVPLVFRPELQPGGWSDRAFDPEAEVEFLSSRLDTVVSYQEKSSTKAMLLEDAAWQPDAETDSFWSGTFVVRLKEVV